MRNTGSRPSSTSANQQTLRRAISSCTIVTCVFGECFVPASLRAAKAWRWKRKAETLLQVIGSNQFCLVCSSFRTTCPEVLNVSEVWHLLVALLGGAAIDLTAGTKDWHPRPIAAVCHCLCSDGALSFKLGDFPSEALSNVVPMPAEPSPIWAVPVALNVLVGVAAPLLWTAQNAYVGRSACAAAELQHEPAEKWTTSSSAANCGV